MIALFIGWMTSVACAGTIPDELREATVNARDASGNTPLHAAALRGDSATVAALLKSGAEVNATNHAGATPLLYGAHNTAIVRDLLDRGANPNMASALGSTPLMA
ncbi:MAG: ankyrin repeat domain-containing protein [Verrucomicrobiota bacterium]